jgi:hypothetical protein
MYWELSGDKCPSDPERPEMEKGPGKDARPGPSLVKVRPFGLFFILGADGVIGQVVADAMGGIYRGTGEEYGGWNWLKYEGSRYVNMRNGME